LTFSFRASFSIRLIDGVYLTDQNMTSAAITRPRCPCDLLCQEHDAVAT